MATQALFSKEDWQALTPSSIFAVVQDSVLYFWYTGNGGGCYGLDLVAKKLTRHDIPATSVCQDAVTDSAFVTSGGNVYQLFAGNRATGRWVSGNVVIQKDAPFAWLQVWGEQDADNPVTFKWYNDGTLLHTATVTSNTPVRLPAGRYREHTLEIASKARITEIAMVSSTEELQSL